MMIRQTYQMSDISILITCYKEGDLLLRAIESVKNQSFQGFEVIIINDCSPDLRTNDICHQLKNEGFKVVFRESNGGLSQARNTGFQNMSGKIAMPLDADDTLPNDAVAHTINTFNKFPYTDMIFGDYLLINEKGEISEKVSCKDIRTEDYSLDPYKLARNWKLMGQSPCSKELWQKVNGYSLEFSNTVQDVDFWRRALLSGTVGKYVPHVLYHWHRTESGMNNSVSEEQYLPLRLASLPFYDQFNPDYGIHIRNYIYRYYSSRLMAQEINEFIKNQGEFFSLSQRIKGKLMRFKFCYKLCRKVNSSFKSEHKVS